MLGSDLRRKGLFQEGKAQLQRRNNGDAFEDRDACRSHRDSSFCLQTDDKDQDSFTHRKKQLLGA